MRRLIEFDFGKRLRQLRKAKGMSQEELAFVSDVSVTYIRYLEKNRKSPTLVIMQKLCAALDVSLEQFFSEGESFECGMDPSDDEIIKTPVTIALEKMIHKMSEPQKKMLYKIAEIVFKEK